VNQHIRVPGPIAGESAVPEVITLIPLRG